MYFCADDYRLRRSRQAMEVEFIVKKHEDYAGNQKVEFFSRRHQAKRLCRFMDSVLEK